MIEVIIKSVGDFLKELETEEIKSLALNCFRGEAKNYGETRLTASGLRNDNGFRTYIYRQFYNEVHARLTNNEKENYLAFCQHHKLPTNLLDMTSNPLIALFFACEKHDNDDGFVYAFNEFSSFSYIDVNNMVKNIEIPDLHTEIEYLCENDYNCNLIIDSLKNSSWLSDIFQIKNDEKKEHDMKISVAIQELHRYMKDKLDDNNKKPDFDMMINLFPVSLYSPLMSFDRATSQHSKFIFQWHTRNVKKTIHPHFSFIIPAAQKKEILFSLDRLHINRATVYQDFDNIAQYIKEKHGYK
jgi:hypothetical protein